MTSDAARRACALRGLRLEQREEREDAALALVVGAHDEGEVLDDDDERERPEDEREDAEDVRVRDARRRAARVKHSFIA